jgi:phosphate starvation-inducible protein PhoH and related proteins
MRRKAEGDKEKEVTPKTRKPFHLEFKNTAQKIAWMAFEQHDILFLLGPAGVGKSHLAVAFAISELLNRKKKKIMLTRPIVEAGEKLGFLPGTFEEKINPYLMPVFDVMDRMVGKESAERERINKSMEIAPMAYLRGRTFHESVCILDEAQNATEEQLKLYLTRLGEDSKIIITGDASQSDLKGDDKYALSRVVESMKVVPGIGVIEFSEENIVRHPLVAAILKAWPTK